MATVALSTDAGKPTYSAGAYWDTRYTGPAKNFDWFFNYPALKTLLQEHLRYPRVLHVGCGNSNIQEGMAADGFTVMNVDISPVVIEQMKHQHADIRSLDYMVADCRDMPELETGSFQSCIDKGTLDAVLCSQTGQVDAAKYLHEIDRLLQPGGTFLLISLGAPSARLALLQKQLWSDIRVLLLPKPLLYLQSDATLTGRPLPSHCAANKDEPIQPLGPWPAEAATQEVASQELDTRDYFFAYICTKASSAAITTTTTTGTAAAFSSSAAAILSPNPAAVERAMAFAAAAATLAAPMTALTVQEEGKGESRQPTTRQSVQPPLAILAPTSVVVVGPPEVAAA